MKIRTIRNIGVVSILVVLIMANTSIASARPLQDPENTGLFNLQFVMTFSWDGNETQEPIKPGELREIPLTITTMVTCGAFGRLLLAFYTGKAYFIHLSIEDASEWCTAALSIEQLLGTIQPNKDVILHSRLYIQLSPNAPGNYTMGFVKLHGVIDDIRGLFNLRTIIHGYEHTSTLIFVTGQ